MTVFQALTSLKFRLAFTLARRLLYLRQKYFRLNSESRFIVGREKKENDVLMKFSDHMDFCCVPAFKGPVILGSGPLTKEVKSFIGMLFSRYGKPSADEGEFTIETREGETIRMSAEVDAIEGIDENRLNKD